MTDLEFLTTGMDVNFDADTVIVLSPVSVEADTEAKDPTCVTPVEGDSGALDSTCEPRVTRDKPMIFICNEDKKAKKRFGPPRYS